MGERTSALFRSEARHAYLHGVNWHEYDAALFDLDGVLTPTAELHMRAWRQLFVDFLAMRGIDQPYVESDYFNYIDGKPRYDGIRAFLASRRVQLAEGDPSDSPQVETVCGLANRKNEFFIALLREEVSDRTPDRYSCLIISRSAEPRSRS